MEIARNELDRNSRPWRRRSAKSRMHYVAPCQRGGGVSVPPFFRVHRRRHGVGPSAFSGFIGHVYVFSSMFFRFLWLSCWSHSRAHKAHICRSLRKALTYGTGAMGGGVGPPFFKIHRGHGVGPIPMCVGTTVWVQHIWAPHERAQVVGRSWYFFFKKKAILGAQWRSILAYFGPN